MGGSPEPTGGEVAAGRRRDSTCAIRVDGDKMEPEGDAECQAHRGATETSTAPPFGTRRGDRRSSTGEMLESKHTMQQQLDFQRLEESPRKSDPVLRPHSHGRRSWREDCRGGSEPVLLPVRMLR